MLDPIDQLAEAERIQGFFAVGPRAPALRIAGSLAVWYYSRGRTDVLERVNRVPRDIDFIYSAGSAGKVVEALRAAGYECDLRLAQESQGSRLRATCDKYKVDAFADPVVLWQTLHFGTRLELCLPCISLTDLLLLKLQIREYDARDYVDICALLVTSYLATDQCQQLDIGRFEKIVGNSWTWWKSVEAGLRRVSGVYEKIVVRDEQRYALNKQVSRARRSLKIGPRSLRWRLERASDAVLPDGVEVDDIT